MADGVRSIRDAIADHSARQVGLRTDQPTTTVANQRTRGQQSDIYAMPVDGTNWQPLQVLDVSDVNFGAFYYLPGYDVPGDPTKVVK